MTKTLCYYIRQSLARRIGDARSSAQRRLHDDARSSRSRAVLKTLAICGGAVCAGIGGYKAWTRQPALTQKVLASSPNAVESPDASDCSKVSRRQAQLENAINYAHELLTRKKDEWGVPGIVVAVSVDGKTVWSEGLGYADIENRVPCGSQTVMRIGSISKPIAMMTVAKLWEEGKIDLDKPIQDYVPSFPNKTFDDKPVVITLRDLVSHVAGIRHYANSKNSSPTKDGNSVSRCALLLQHIAVKYSQNAAVMRYSAVTKVLLWSFHSAIFFLCEIFYRITASVLAACGLNITILNNILAPWQF
ncbi:serine beta-lactamase-like protein LACTB, mitochondrial [Rhipicephalus microplus]|uniref:serine beta-lactamase-like protein LACTB, mitochondrial n=1 Tax=Rhipicephalus microplus TaxID=6941 RepID=UPI003F6D29D8